MIKYQKKSKENTLRDMFCYIKSVESFTALEISKELRKTLPIINANLKHFQEQDYINFDTQEEGGLGRPAKIWRSKILQLSSLCAELRQNKIIIAEIELSGKILQKEEYDIDNQESHKQLLDSYIEQIKLFMKKYNLAGKYSSIGISVIGTVDFNRKMLVYSSNMSVKNLDFKYLENILGIEVILENNANAAILGEFFMDSEMRDAIFVSITKNGVGGGHIFEQKLQKGISRNGGEIGHMSIDIHGLPCSCGRRGCFERYVSEQGFISIFAQHNITITSIDSIFENITTLYMRIIREYVMYLSRGIQNLICILDPATIIFGGFIARHWSFFKPLILEDITFNNNIIDNNKINIKPSLFLDNASIYGAATLPYISLFYNKEVYC